MKQNNITARKAGAIIRDELATMGIELKVTAQTVSFEDLARVSRVFVTIHNWRSVNDPQMFTHLHNLARERGFYVETAEGVR